MPTKVLQIPTADGQADGFAAIPEDGDRHPGVLLYSDAFGVRPELEQRASELARHGYYVLVPNIYYRYGPAPVIELPEHIGEEIRPAVMGQLMPLIEAHTTQRVLRDADAYLRFLTALPEVSAGPVAVIGYCIGAALAMRTATAHPGQVAAVAGFHPGFLVTSAPDSPHRLVPNLTAQVHLGLAEGDMKPEAISELNQALDAAGVGYATEIYPGTIHGFTMSDTGAFNPSALQRHWDRLLPLLDRTLASGQGSGPEAKPGGHSSAARRIPRLRCGIILHSEEDACQVLAGGKTVSARYASQFPAPRRERVLPGHLVAIAETAEAAAVVWRWYDAVVLGSDESSVRLWEPAHGEVAAQRRRPQQQYAPGTRAYLSAGLPGADWWVAGRAVDQAEDADVELDEVERLYTEHGMWNSAFG
jgi:carboxymethylenebutenolidase